MRNTNEQGAIWTLKWKGGKHHYGERDGMFFFGSRASLVYTYELRFIKSWVWKKFTLTASSGNFHDDSFLNEVIREDSQPSST